MCDHTGSLEVSSRCQARRTSRVLAARLTGEGVAVVPWLCVPTFPWVCSEQRLVSRPCVGLEDLSQLPYRAHCCGLAMGWVPWLRLIPGAGATRGWDLWTRRHGKG